MRPTVVTLCIDRADAGRVDAILMEFDEENVPSVTAFAPEEGAPILNIQAFYPDVVDDVALSAALGDYDVAVEPLPDIDWVSQSQSMLPAITAGRFHVYGAHVAETLKPGQIGLWIEANQAFGTGRHETTFGCLVAIDWLIKRRRFNRVLDLGSGSGVLGLGVAKAQPRPVMMSDLDPVSIDVARENAELNHVPLRQQARIGRGVQMIAAAGLGDPRLRAAAPYDLVLANILARPLQDLAKDITRVTRRDGIIVLAGLLDSQEAAVLSRYRAHGWRLKKRISSGHWPTLILRKLL
ncbi:MAG: 50S ribosomal protein L11 methyltransferase [Pseudomonadota bacterium]